MMEISKAQNIKKMPITIIYIFKNTLLLLTGGHGFT